MMSMETLIDPQAQSLSSVVVEDCDYEYNYIRDLIDCRVFSFVRLYDNGDGVYIDDEGLYAENRYFWIHRNYPQPLVNKGMFAGTDPEGDIAVPQTSFKTLEKDIHFIGDTHDLQVMMMFNKSKISMENGYEDYRPIFF
tara:strand:+ start:646 stop:1062 length:417 start_codon:yes stop_codon:yes gene_type:complete